MLIEKETINLQPIGNIPYGSVISSEGSYYIVCFGKEKSTGVRVVNLETGVISEIDNYIMCKCIPGAKVIIKE